jgi:uncharacterized cupredoxin-like copper-binding protein
MSSESRTFSGANARRMTSLALAAGLTVTVAACGSSAKKASPKAASSAATVATPTPVAKVSTAPAPKVNRVVVTETDFKLALSSTSFHAGYYTFSAKNVGHTKHALAIVGPGLANKPTSATLTPGQTSDLIVPLKKGGYELWCPIGNHKAMGMVARITVS